MGKWESGESGESGEIQLKPQNPKTLKPHFPNPNVFFSFLLG
ncbi:hypothetical protein BFG60_0057 [Microcystis aeruginosa NIES-98]|nr:hypothetical protein BFG60_0057 [Microcystis aeruginosa NIES-98]